MRLISKETIQGIPNTIRKRLLLRFNESPYVTLQQACWLLGPAMHQARILIQKEMLIPIGRRRTRKSVLFATAYILELVDDLELACESQRHAFT